MPIYTTEHIESVLEIEDKLLDFLRNEAELLSGIYENKFDWKSFNIGKYLADEGGHLWVCYRNEYPVGVMLARLYASIFDDKTRILFQDALYVKIYGSRVCYDLLKQFVDFGKTHADHIITCRGLRTHIKRRSIEKLGFSKLEELYRMEV